MIIKCSLFTLLQVDKYAAGNNKGVKKVKMNKTDFLHSHVLNTVNFPFMYT